MPERPFSSGMGAETITLNFFANPINIYASEYLSGHRWWDDCTPAGRKRSMQVWQEIEEYLQVAGERLTDIVRRQFFGVDYTQGKESRDIEVYLTADMGHITMGSGAKYGGGDPDLGRRGGGGFIRGGSWDLGVDRISLRSDPISNLALDRARANIEAKARATQPDWLKAIFATLGSNPSGFEQAKYAPNVRYG